MRQILSTITVFFVLLTSPVSWGSPNGKGILCGEKVVIDGEVQRYPMYFIFSNNKVTRYHFDHDDKTVSTIELGVTLIDHENKREIGWTNYGGIMIIFTLNRKTLILTRKIYGRGIDEFKCEVFSKEKLLEKVDSLIKQYQTELDEYNNVDTSKNQI